MDTLKLFTVSLLFFSVSISNVFGHCQIPCGIYGDEARFNAMLEDVATLKKSVMKIAELEAGERSSMNQLLRWVQNKEDHANKISKVAHEYFLAQRIKPGQHDYEANLVAIHHIIVSAMKVKQAVNQGDVEKLESEILKFKHLYFHDH